MKFLGRGKRPQSACPGKGNRQSPHMCLVPLAAPATTATTEPRGAFRALSFRDSSSLRLAPPEKKPKRGVNQRARS